MKRPPRGLPAFSGAARGGTSDARDAHAERERIEAADKRFVTLAARFALAGFTLTIVDGPAPFVVSRWSLCREFDSIEGAERFLADVTGGSRLP